MARDPAIYRRYAEGNNVRLNAIVALADSLIAEGMPEEAIAMLSAILDGSPVSPLMRIRRARAYAASGDWSAVVADFSTQIPLQRLTAWDLALRAKALEKTGDVVAAAADWERARILARQNGGAHSEMDLMFDSESWLEAVKVGRKQLRVRPGDAINWLGLAVALARLETTDEYESFRGELAGRLADSAN